MSQRDDLRYHPLLLLGKRIHASLECFSLKITDQLSVLNLSSTILVFLVGIHCVLAVHTVKVSLQLLHLLLTLEVHAPAGAHVPPRQLVLHLLAGLLQLATLQKCLLNLPLEVLLG